MKVKELKNKKVFNVEIITYSSYIESIVNILHKVGITDIYVNDNYKILVKCSIKQLLKLEEIGLFDFEKDSKLKINCQRDLNMFEEA